jgi:hypothetical protein
MSTLRSPARYSGVVPITFSGGFFTNGETAPNKKAFHLLVGVAGAVHFDDSDGLDKTLTLQAGIHPISFVRIIESGTAATGLGALKIIQE